MPKALEVTRTLALEDLKELAGSEGPCLTLFLPLERKENAARLSETRLKNLLRSAEQKLAGTAEAAGLLGPLGALADEREFGTAGGTLVLLRSKDVLRAVEVREPVEEAVHLGSAFHVRPLLRALAEEKLVFYILALSQKHVRLLRCTNHSSEEVELPPGVPTSLEAWLNTRAPNSAPNHGATETAEPGSTSGSFTSTTDVDNKDQHLANFFRAVNKGLHDRLREDTTPMILCGVDNQRVMYRQVSDYPHLLEDGVPGSPESLKGGEMHKRALEIAREHAKEPLKKALATYEKLGGTERVSDEPDEIVKAAHLGRVAVLFLSENKTYQGCFDKTTMETCRNTGRDEDLTNLAALQTIAYGGEVYVTPLTPGQAPMAALLRF